MIKILLILFLFGFYINDIVAFFFKLKKIACIWIIINIIKMVIKINSIYGTSKKEKQEHKINLFIFFLKIQIKKIVLFEEKCINTLLFTRNNRKRKEIIVIIKNKLWFQNSNVLYFTMWVLFYYIKSSSV